MAIPDHLLVRNAASLWDEATHNPFLGSLTNEKHRLECPTAKFTHPRRIGLISSINLAHKNRRHRPFRISARVNSMLCGPAICSTEPFSIKQVSQRITIPTSPACLDSVGKTQNRDVGYPHPWLAPLGMRAFCCCYDRSDVRFVSGPSSSTVSSSFSPTVRGRGDGSRLSSSARLSSSHRRRSS